MPNLHHADAPLLDALLRGTPQRVRPRALAAVLGVTPKTLENWRKAGKGPPFLALSPRKIRYDLSAVHAWLANLAVASVARCPHCGAVKPALRERARREVSDAQG